MVRVKGPLLSLRASKSIARTITFQKRRGKDTAYLYSKPSGPPSAAQQEIRQNMAEAVQYWKMLSPEEQQEWQDFISGQLSP